MTRWRRRDFGKGFFLLMKSNRVSETLAPMMLQFTEQDFGSHRIPGGYHCDGRKSAGI